jgi:hypothetical protein
VAHCSKSEVSKTLAPSPNAYNLEPSAEYQTREIGPEENPAKPRSSDKFPALRQSNVTGVFCAKASEANPAAREGSIDTDLYPNDTRDCPIVTATASYYRQNPAREPVAEFFCNRHATC